MSEIRFYRVLIWLPLIVPILLAPFWLPHGVEHSSGPVYILTVGAGYVAVPYALLALWTDRWLRATPRLATREIWRRTFLLPVQLIPLFMVWNIGRALVTGASPWEYLIEALGYGLTYVLWLGYLYIGLACGLTRLCMWAGCVRAPAQA